MKEGILYFKPSEDYDAHESLWTPELHNRLSSLGKSLKLFELCHLYLKLFTGLLMRIQECKNVLLGKQEIEYSQRNTRGIIRSFKFLFFLSEFRKWWWWRDELF